jgi:hypothetical protein
MAQVVVQKLNKQEDSEINLAIRYFSIIAAISNIHLTKKQIELLALTSIKGTISSGGARQEFIEIFDSSKASFENLKHSLVIRGLIVKQEGKHKVIPSLCPDFRHNLLLQVKLDLKPNGQPEDREDKSA